MLKSLSIQNLILVERVDLIFKSEFTVITGETGAGKTTLLEAIKLILGERADASKVRKGSKKARITATFEGDFSDQLKELFKVSGISISHNEPLIITREISKEGKSRCFVSGEQVTLKFLSKVGSQLVEIIDQHSQINLKNLSTQRNLLDEFAYLDSSLFQSCLLKEKSLIESLEKEKEKKRKIDPDSLQDQIEQLNSLTYKPGEEDLLFTEFSLLSNSEKIQMHSNAASEIVDQTLLCCHKLSKHLEELPIDEAKTLTNEIKLQFIEISSLLNSVYAKFEHNPQRLKELETRLHVIDHAKKRFGKDLLRAKEHLEKQLMDFEIIEQNIKELEKALEVSRNNTNFQAEILTKNRKESAKILEQLLSFKMKKLNVTSAKIDISILPTTRSHTGDDSVNFFLKANRGEKMVPIKDSSSGGELSRLLFCLRLILLDSGKKTTLVFDEIDAGVGGETATLMGTQISDLAKNGQIFCITHFPQVAKFAKNHLCVLKYENQERTHCEMRFLEPKERKNELIRMSGGSQMQFALIP